MKIRPGTDWATAPRTSPSCDTWRSTSCKRTQPRDPCAGSSSAPAGTTPTSPVCSPYSEVRLPCVQPAISTWPPAPVEGRGLSQDCTIWEQNRGDMPDYSNPRVPAFCRSGERRRAPICAGLSNPTRRLTIDWRHQFVTLSTVTRPGPAPNIVYGTGGTSGPWLAAIARYKWIDRLRSLKSEATEPLDENIGVPDHEEAVVTGSTFHQLLAELKAPQAEAIRLVKLEGYSVEEASSATGQ